jgi:hypothetical protein
MPGPLSFFRNATKRLIPASHENIHEHPKSGHFVKEKATPTPTSPSPEGSHPSQACEPLFNLTTTQSLSDRKPPISAPPTHPAHTRPATHTHTHTHITSHTVSKMAPTDFVSLFGDTLLTADGERPTADVLAGLDAVGIYFSAHWCPPCRRFTPEVSWRTHLSFPSPSLSFPLSFLSLSPGVLCLTKSAGHSLL